MSSSRATTGVPGTGAGMATRSLTAQQEYTRVAENRVVRGRQFWPSDPVVVEVGADGSITVVSEVGVYSKHASMEANMKQQTTPHYRHTLTQP